VRSSLLPLALLCAIGVSAPSFAAKPSAQPRPVNLAMVRALALQPLALVKGNQCLVRGAVMAGTRPRADVRVQLVSSSGQTFTTKTNAAGIYAASLPFAGTTTAYRERIAGEIRVPTHLASQARVLRPAFVCSKKLTDLILANQIKGA
jgi:hypothetical protein